MKKKSIDKRKLHRVLRIIMKLYDGQVVNLHAESKRNKVTIRTIQRDMYSAKSLCKHVDNLGLGDYKVDALKLEEMRNDLKK